MTNFDADINDFVPSLLSPRTERIDPISQSTQKIKLQLSLKKRQNNITTFSPRNHVFTSTQSQKREFPLECDISPIKKSGRTPLFQNDEFIYSNEDRSELAGYSENVCSNTLSSHVLLNNSQSLMSQDLRYCRNCQLPTPPEEHEINCAGPKNNNLECTKGDKCYSSVASHFIKYKHSMLKNLRLRFTRHKLTEIKHLNSENTSRSLKMDSNKHVPLQTRSRARKNQLINTDDPLDTQKININGLNNDVSQLSRSSVNNANFTENKKTLQKKSTTNKDNDIIDLTLSYSKANQEMQHSKLPVSKTNKSSKQPLNKYIDDSPSKLHFSDKSKSASKKVSRNLFSKNTQENNVETLNIRKRNINNINDDKVPINKLQKRNIDNAAPGPKSKKNEGGHRITRSQRRTQSAVNTNAFGVNIMTHIPEKITDLENWFNKHGNSNIASNSSATISSSIEKNPCYEFEDILRIAATEVSELVDSMDNVTVIFDKNNSYETDDRETELQNDKNENHYNNDTIVIPSVSKIDCVYDKETRIFAKPIPDLVDKSVDDTFITCESEPIEKSSASAINLNSTIEKSGIIALPEESCKCCKSDTAKIQFILNGAGSSESTIVLNAEVNRDGWGAVAIDASNQINFENNEIQLCKCKKNLKISCTAKNSKAKGKVVKLNKKPQNLSRKLDANLRNKDNLDQSVDITTLTQTSIVSFFRTKKLSPCSTELNVTHQASQTETTKTNFEITNDDSDIEIIDWDTTCKPKLENIIVKARECNLNLDFISANSSCDGTSSINSTQSVPNIRVKTVSKINNGYFPNNSLTTIAKKVTKTNRKTRVKRDPKIPKPKKICPPEKLIEETPFAVDAFTYGAIDNVEIYFLTHYHADHYMGLTKKFDKPLYCSQVTANLVLLNIKMHKSYINIIEPDTTIKLFGIEVTALSANHCPGSLMLLFRLQDGRYILHTGDFRADANMEFYPHLCNKPNIYKLHLDTTYCNPSYKFPPQSESIAMAVKKTAEWINHNRHDLNLIVVGAYTIGKELVWLQLCQTFNLTIWVDKDRKRNLDALGDPIYTQYIEEDPLKASIHILGLGNLSYDYLSGYLDKFRGHFKRILAIKPSGWQYCRKPIIRGNITIFGVPYSEHSSYSELSRFVGFLRPQNIVATAGNHKHLTRLAQDAGKPEKAVNTIDKYLITKRMLKIES